MTGLRRHVSLAVHALRPGPRALRASRTARAIVVTAILAALLVGLLPSGLPAGRLVQPWERGEGEGVALAGELEDTQRELDRVRKLIEQKQAELERLSTQEKSLVKEINRIQKEIDTLEKDLDQLDAQLRATERTIAETEVDIADATARLEVRNALVLKRVRAMSEVGYVNYLEVLLGSRSFADFVARFELLRQVLAADVTLFREVKEEKRQLEAKKAYLEEQKTQLSQVKSETAARKAAVEQRQAAKSQLLAQLREDKAETEKALDELENLSKELERIIFEIQRASQWAGGKPTFIWPVAGPITSRFGWRLHPILKVQKFHTGIDIAAPRGTPVKASATGKVIWADWLGGYGKCVILDNGGMWSTLYAHLDSIEPRVQNFAVVLQGEVIGRIGSTGYSTGPHLHFEIRFEGQPQDPLRPDLLPSR